MVGEVEGGLLDGFGMLLCCEWWRTAERELGMIFSDGWSSEDIGDMV